MIEFSEEEYNKIEVDHAAWPYDQVVDLFEKMKRYNFNFIVVHDRLADSKWTAEDIKEVVIIINRSILLSVD